MQKVAYADKSKDGDSEAPKPSRTPARRLFSGPAREQRQPLVTGADYLPEGSLEAARGVVDGIKHGTQGQWWPERTPDDLSEERNEQRNNAFRGLWRLHIYKEEKGWEAVAAAVTVIKEAAARKSFGKGLELTHALEVREASGRWADAGFKPGYHEFTVPAPQARCQGSECKVGVLPQLMVCHRTPWGDRLMVTRATESFRCGGVKEGMMLAAIDGGHAPLDEFKKVIDDLARARASGRASLALTMMWEAMRYNGRGNLKKALISTMRECGRDERDIARFNGAAQQSAHEWLALLYQHLETETEVFKRWMKNRLVTEKECSACRWRGYVNEVAEYLGPAAVPKPGEAFTLQEASDYCAEWEYLKGQGPPLCTAITPSQMEKCKHRECKHTACEKCGQYDTVRKRTLPLGDREYMWVSVNRYAGIGLKRYEEVKLEEEELWVGKFQHTPQGRVIEEKRVKYKVVAWLMHDGASLNSGHYRAFVKHQSEGQWIFCSDEIVAPARNNWQEDYVNRRDAYIALLEKR
eukprot:gene2313-29494_t